MGIETLYTAAYAAGFAMATIEEDFEELRAAPSAPKAAAVRAAAVGARWQPSRSLLLHETPHKADTADWVRLLLGLLGRRVPARRAALTAEA